MPLNPAKSTTIQWLTGTWVSAMNWRIVQAGPPTLNASFHMAPVVGSEICLPLLSRQPGRSMTESRGMLTPYARDRSAERCSRIVVSERWPMPVRLSTWSPGSVAVVGPHHQDVDRPGRGRPLGGVGDVAGTDRAVEVLRVEVAVVVAVEEDHGQPGHERDHHEGAVTTGQRCGGPSPCPCACRPRRPATLVGVRRRPRRHQAPPAPSGGLGRHQRGTSSHESELTTRARSAHPIEGVSKV